MDTGIRYNDDPRQQEATYVKVDMGATITYLQFHYVADDKHVRTVILNTTDYRALLAASVLVQGVR